MDRAAGAEFLLEFPEISAGSTGDLIVDGGDPYGDGVNVAARLEAEATAGRPRLSRLRLS